MIKKILTFIFLMPIFANGQNWAPIGAKWIYDHDEGMASYLTIIESIKDTVVLNKSCKKLTTKEINEVMEQDASYSWDTIFASNDFIYTSNDTVFHYNKFANSFYPLYLQNIKAKDTILIRDNTTPCTENEYFCSRFEYVVDSISNLSLQENNLKLIYNSTTSSSEWMFNRSWLSENYPIVENIGSLKYFFGVSRNVVMEGGISCLRCYTDDNISYKSATWTEDCDYLRPLNTPSSVQNFGINDLVVFPNPFNSFINISNNYNYSIEYELYNSFGQLLEEGNEEIINTASLTEGIYLLKVTLNKKETQMIKLVKHLR